MTVDWDAPWYHGSPHVLLELLTEAMVAVLRERARSRQGARRRRPAAGRHRMTTIVSISGALLDRLRAICLALPEAVEAGGVGNPSFTVRKKIFAMQHGVDARPSLWVKAPRGFQSMSRTAAGSETGAGPWSR